MRKLHKAISIIVFDIFFFGVALATSGAYSILNGNNVLNWATIASNSTIFANQTQIYTERATITPVPGQYILGIWLMFFAALLFFDFLIVFFDDIEKAFNTTDKIVVWVRKPLTDSEVEEKLLWFKMRLNNLNEKVKVEQPEEATQATIRSLNRKIEELEGRPS